MGEPGTSLPSERLEERLDSWKEIAAYLNRDVTTVQRWEKREGMPVCRHLHDRSGSVYAFRSELDAWMRSRNLVTAQENGNTGSSSTLAPPAAATVVVRNRWALVLGLAALAVVFAITLAWVGKRRWPGATAEKSIESLAVLPLDNLSHDPEQEYFSDGMTDALITQLSKTGALRITSLTSVMSYKGTHKSLPQIGKELSVDGVIEGSVMRAGNRVRIAVQLVQTRTDRHLWAETYDRDVGDMLRLQSEVAKAVAQQVQMQLTPEQQARLGSAPVGGWLWHSRQASVLSEKDTIVLGDFTNSTGDAVFDGTLRQGLSVQLEQSPFLSLVPEEGIHQMLRMMERSPNTRLTPEITREICQRTGSAAALDGSIALIGTRYDLILRAVNCSNGDLLASSEAQANDKSHVLDALSKVASEMRTKLGESLTTVQKYNTPLEQATTPSLEALQAYSLGARVLNEQGDSAAALPFWQRAVQLDPNFAAAYDALGYEDDLIGTELAVENTRKAFELRTRVSEREKLIIEGDYYFIVTRELLKARQTYMLGERIYPRDVTFPINLGVIYNALGQYEEGLREYQEGVRLAPYAINYRFLVYTYLLLNRDEDAAALAREAQRKGADSSLEPILYALAFYRNDAAEMARQVTAAAGKQGLEDLVLALDADTAAYFGHLGRARELSRQASNSAKRAGENERSTTYAAVAALREGLFGNVNQAGQWALAKERSGGPDKYYAVVLALAYAGEGAQGSENDFTKSFPESTVIQFNYLPTLRAKLALNHSNPQQAINTLEVATPYELGVPAFWFYNWPSLYPVYVRGEAYLAAHMGREAAAEFQKILDRRGIVLNEPIGALAHLQLGRAYALQGDTAKACGAYQDFLTLWKDADPDIPILIQAKAEYTKLR